MRLLLLSALALLPGRQDPGTADFAAFEKQLKELDAASDAASLSSLGRSNGGRDLWLLTIAKGKAADKPAILIVGSVHAPHLAGSELAVRMAKALAKDEKLLERVALYVIPRPNPDASEAFFAKPRRERTGNGRKTNDDRDAEAGEDPPEDLNGDGVITLMRVEDETGTHMAHPDDPRVLIAADRRKNEQPKYAVYVEGRDNDGDGLFNEDAGDGVDFNRNFPHQYPYFKPGAGPHAVSEPETRAVADFAFDRPNLAAVFCFSPEDNLFHPWKADAGREGARIKTTLHSADSPFVDHVAEAYRAIHGGADCPAPPAGEGSFASWAYFQLGRWSFAARAWWPPKVPPEKEEKEKRGADEINALRWMKKEGIEGFVEWTAIEHPDFRGRKVEVGGFRPFALLNPPAKELDALAAKHAEFVVRLAELLPRVKISDAKIEDLGEGIARVTVTVVNSGYLPTMSEMGRITNQLQGLQARIELPEGASLVKGVARVKLDPIGGNGGKAEPSWLVKLPEKKEATVTVWSPSVGSDSRKVSR